ncbi:MAG TPA: outer membrane beta-barrel protein [Ignavibacteria bacterium]|jgi:opacity protein-like surface antigen
MKVIKISVVFLSLVLLSTSYSQISISLGPVVGYTSPSGDYSGTPQEYYNGTNYGLSGGIHFGAMARVKIPFLSGRLSVLYASLSNDGSTGSGTGQTVEVKHKLLTIAIGPEFFFSLPAVPIRPYAGIDLLFTSFSGETIFQGTSAVPSGTSSMSSASRTGLGLGIGVNVGFGKKFSLDAGIKYNMHNLFGKEFKGGNNRIDSYTSLNDDKDPLFASGDDKHFIASDRSISTIQFNLGFLFDF